MNKLLHIIEEQDKSEEYPLAESYIEQGGFIEKMFREEVYQLLIYYLKLDHEKAKEISDGSLEEMWLTSDDVVNDAVHHVRTMTDENF